jgi:hypothetical protein
MQVNPPALGADRIGITQATLLRHVIRPARRAAAATGPKARAAPESKR